MSDDYQLRKDIDKFKKFLNDLQALMDSKGIEDLDIQSLLSQYYDMSEVDISNSEINNRIDELDNKISNVDININTKLSQLLLPNIDVTEVAYLIGNGVDTEQLNQLTENGYDISTIQYVYNSAGETYYLDNGVWSLLDEFPSWLSDPVMGIKLDMIPNVDQGGVGYNSEPFEYIFSVSDGKYWIHFDDAFYEMGDLNSFFQFTELYKVIKYLFDENIPINYVVLSKDNTLTEDVSTFIVGEDYYFIIRAFQGSSEIYVNDIRCKIDHSGAIDELTLVNSDDWRKVFKFTPMEQKGHVLRVYRSDTLVATYTFDAIIDTGWQNVSFLDDYTNYSGSNLKIRRIGNIVEINGSWTALKDKTASTSPTPFATIAEEFRPESVVYIRQQGRAMNTYLLVVEPNGNVSWFKYGTSSSSNLTATHQCTCHALWTVNGGAVGGGGSTGTGGSNVDLSNYYTKGELDALIPNELSDLINDTGFITSSALPSKLSDLTNDTGFITLSALNDYVTKDNLSIKYSNEIPTEVDPSEPYSLCIVKSSNGYDVYSIQEPSTGGSGEWVKSATIPSDFAISSHNHNDLYYTKSEVDNMNLGGGGGGEINLSNYLQAVYPVGSIYMSVNTVSPSIIFGFGVWEKIEDKFLLGSGTTYANGSTGGSADAVIVSHSHQSSANGEYIVTSEEDTANNTKVAYSASGNRWVDGQPSQSHFHHRTRTSTVGEDGTNKNMPPYIAVNIWKRIE